VGPSHRSEALCVESKIGCALIGIERRSACRCRM
jgi:hypothetical protein